MRGVDISVYQGNFTNLSLLKAAGFNFAIIKISEGLSTDRCFEQHYSNCEKYGIARGVYVYSHANSISKAKAEANYLLKVLNGRKLEMPVFIDLEADDINFAWNHNIMPWVLAFGETIKAGGYRWGTYSNQSWYLNKLNIEQLKRAGATIWVSGYNGTEITIPHDIWQYNNKGYIPGYNDRLDMNLLYDESIIKYNDEKPEEKPEEKPGITIAEAIQKVIDLAKSQVGYKEKRTNNNLDDFTANAGNNNWNKYARDIDTKWPTFYNGKKNGYSWCDIFVDWLFLTLFGYTNTLKMLYAPEKSTGAGCSFSANFYKAKGKFFTTPQVGDQVFFGQYGNEGHTGIVIEVTGRVFKTVEGNTSGGYGIDANGDGVYIKTYNLDNTYIPGFGRPDYSIVSNGEVGELPNGEASETYPIVQYGDINLYVKKAQQLLVEKGYSIGAAGADGDFGNDTLTAVRKFQKDNNLTVDGIVGPATWEKLLKINSNDQETPDDTIEEIDTSNYPLVKLYSQGTYVRKLQQKLVELKYLQNDGEIDGIFGYNTYIAVKNFQKDHGLIIDGEVGQNTWKILINSSNEESGEVIPPISSEPETPSYTQPNISISISFPLLKKNNTHQKVKILCELLKNRNYYNGDIIENYIEEIEESVKKFQKDHGLSTDGQVGFNTWNSLFK